MMRDIMKEGVLMQEILDEIFKKLKSVVESTGLRTSFLGYFIFSV
jgi:hypothetical protein